MYERTVCMAMNIHKSRPLYYGYWNDQLLGISTELKAVKSYLKNTRRCDGEATDIVERHKRFDELTVDEENMMLVKYNKKYITAKDGRIILRDFNFFMDNILNAADTLEFLDKLFTFNGLLDTAKICRYILDTAYLKGRLFQKFFNDHDLVKDDVISYMVKKKEYPSYMMEDE